VALGLADIVAARRRGGCGARKLRAATRTSNGLKIDIHLIIKLPFQDARRSTNYVLRFRRVFCSCCGIWRLPCGAEGRGGQAGLVDGVCGAGLLAGHSARRRFAYSETTIIVAFVSGIREAGKLFVRGRRWQTFQGSAVLLPSLAGQIMGRINMGFSIDLGDRVFDLVTSGR